MPNWGKTKYTKNNCINSGVERMNSTISLFIPFIIFDGVLWPNKKKSPTTSAIAYPTPAAIIVF